MPTRICLISPAHVAFNPRLVKEADALTEAGFSVHVIAANDLPQLRHLDEAVFTRAGWTWSLAGGRFLADKARRAVARTARVTYGAGFTHLRVAEFGAHALTAELVATALKHKANLYIAHNLAAVPAACHAAARHGAKWGFDAEDYHFGQFEEYQRASVEARIVQHIESTYLADAMHFTAASPGIADAYASVLGRAKPEVVLNVFPRSQAPSSPTSKGRASPGPSIYWFSQTIGTNRGLESAIRAISKAGARPHFYMRGNMQAGFEERLRGVAAGAGVSDQIHFLPPAPAADMEKLAAEHDIGFAGEPGHSTNNDLAIANKIFTYLLAGLPVLASKTKGHSAIAAECSAVEIFETERADENLAALIDSYLLSPAKLAEARHRAWTCGQERFNWENESGKLVRAVSRLIGPP